LWGKELQQGFREEWGGQRRMSCHGSRHVGRWGVKWLSVKFVSTKPCEVTKIPLRCFA
jgi:hypothetical protein